MGIKIMDMRTILEKLKEKEAQEKGNSVVEYVQVECTKMKDKAVVVKIQSNSDTSEERNGNKPLVETDILLQPGTFGFCDNEEVCKPDIGENRWYQCDNKNEINGQPSVTMTSFMFCVTNGGVITLVNDGQEIKGGMEIDYTSPEYYEFLMKYESGNSTVWRYAHDPHDGTVTIAHGVVIKGVDGSFPLGKEMYEYYIERKEKQIPLSDEEVHNLTQIRLAKYIADVRNKIDEEGWEVSQNRFDAMVDLVWNLGHVALGYRAFELLATCDFDNLEQKRELEKEILETAYFRENGVSVWSKNLTERRLDLVEMAEGGADAYEKNEFTNDFWNENARQLFLDKGVITEEGDIYPFQKVK